MPTTITLLSPTEYINQAADAINKATERVCLLSLVISEDDTTERLIQALIDASIRGIEVYVAADIFTYGELGGFVLPTRYRSKQSKITSNMAKKLQKNGVKFTWLGKSRATIFNGRTHMKWCIVDDEVFSFGGVNLYFDGLDNSDFMLRMKNKWTADKLYEEYHRLIKADKIDYSYHSHSFFVDDFEVLIDGGIFGDSIIYRRACQLAREASDVTLVSQYCPTGKLSKLLKATNTKLYFNPPQTANFINRLVISTGMFLSGNKSLYKKSEYLHAKFIIFTMKDGHKIAITGSHNFVNAGVLLGAREIALQTANPQVIKQLEGFFKDSVA